MSNQPITVAELLAALRARPADQTVRFDFGGVVPTHFDSYRGYYDHLALGWYLPQFGSERPTVGKLIEQLEGCVGRIFEGYKGGEYRMSYDTPVWVANYGRSHGTAIVGLERVEYETIIRTAHCDDWEGSFARMMSVFGPVLFGVDVGSDASKLPPATVTR